MVQENDVNAKFSEGKEWGTSNKSVDKIKCTPACDTERIASVQKQWHLKDQNGVIISVMDRSNKVGWPHVEWLYTFTFTK